MFVPGFWAVRIFYYAFKRVKGILLLAIQCINAICKDTIILKYQVLWTIEISFKTTVYNIRLCSLFIVFQVRRNMRSVLYQSFCTTKRNINTRCSCTGFIYNSLTARDKG